MFVHHFLCFLTIRHTMTMKTCIAKQILRYNEYISVLTIPDQFKQILEVNSSNTESHVYLIYPYLFESGFAITDIKKINFLSIAGYLTFSSINYLDKLTDNQVKPHERSLYLQLSLLCQEEAIKILTTLFPIDAKFWKFWNLRRGEYLLAQKKEKKDFAELSMAEYHEIADQKAAFGKVAIDALLLLEKDAKQRINSNTKAKALLQSHRHFSIGRQFYDDIIDVQEDFVNNQANYALKKLKKSCLRARIDFDKLSTTSLEKYMYVLEVAEDILREAITHFDKAILLAEKYLSKDALWIATINKFKGICSALQLKQSSYLKEINATVSHSATKKIDPNKSITYENCIALGTNFILNKLQPEGYWEEYLNSAGASSTWATSFIYSQIHAMDNEFVTEKVKNKVLAFLEERKKDTISYNQISPRDGDSLSFYMTASHLLGNTVNAPLSDWLKYIHNNGGFSTYIKEDRIGLEKLMKIGRTHYGTWEKPQHCVSAAALYTFALIRNDYRVEEPLEELISYFLEAHKKGPLTAYWWTSSIYTYSYLLKAILLLDDQRLNILLMPIAKYIIEQQQKDGAYGDAQKSKSAFYTGLVVTALCSSELLFINFKDQIKKAIDWLFSNQYDDGSWEATHAMRLPEFNFNPTAKMHSQEWPIRRMGIKVRAVEFNRLFSTSTALNAINTYENVRL